MLQLIHHSPRFWHPGTQLSILVDPERHNEAAVPSLPAIWLCAADSVVGRNTGACVQPAPVWVPSIIQQQPSCLAFCYTLCLLPPCHLAASEQFDAPFFFFFFFFLPSMLQNVRACLHVSEPLSCLPMFVECMRCNLIYCYCKKHQHLT